MQLMKNSLFRVEWSWKIATVVVLLSLILCFFLGSFANAPFAHNNFNERSWYYINRGYPVPFAGVSLASRPVDLPVMKLPFLVRTMGTDTFDKVMDLRVFLPMLLITVVILYPLAFSVIKAFEGMKLYRVTFLPVLIVLILVLVWSYFSVFPLI